MKKLIIYGFFALLATVPLSSAIAAEGPIALGSKGAVKSSDQQPAIDEALSSRKQKVGIELQNLYTRLAAISDRTANTISRLNGKGVDTSAAKAELDMAAASLATAKQLIDQPAEPARITLNLKEGRTHIIASLVALKAAISNSPSAE